MHAALTCIALLATAHAEADRPMPRLVTHTVNAYANWSPDGRTLVYQSDALGNWDIYTILTDGREKKLIISDKGHDITPVWSPDGSKILFVSERDGNREVYVASADGTNQINLTNDKAHDLHPMWSRDGSRIIFSSNRGNDDRDDYDIYEMSADGSNVKRITSGPEIDTYASWSPDGTKIVTRRVIEGDNEVFVMNADGTNPVNLSNAPMKYDGWPVWSPDGAWIAYAGGGPDRGNRYIILVRPDGTGRLQLTHPWVGEHCYDTQPCFSPDGRQLVFTRYRPAGRYESTELCVMDLPKIG